MLRISDLIRLALVDVGVLREALKKSEEQGPLLDTGWLMHWQMELDLKRAEARLEELRSMENAS